MRPIRLKISAFGPYVKLVDLDFEKDLGGENFFLIHGATGSGKTTILDAICYALYGDSSGGGRKGSMMRSEQAAPTDKTEVEFTFALRGKRYTIRRNPKYTRARVRGDGTTEEKASAEIFENGQRLEAKDVSECVENLLGLGKEQFRQVVMLPQGAFQKFLLSKSDDKQKVLNTLFNAEFFKRVEDELKLRAADAKNVFKVLTERKKSYLEEIACSEEEMPALIEKLSDELEAAQAQLKTLETEALSAQKNYSDGENLAKLFNDLEKKSRALTEAQDTLGRVLNELSAVKAEFDKRTAEEPQREGLKILAAELAKKKVALRNLSTKQKELESAEKSVADSAKKISDLKKLKKSCDDTMTQVQADVEKLQDAPAKLKVAEQKLKDAQSREKLLEEIKTLRGKISVAEKNLIAAKKSFDNAEKNLDDLREAQKSGSAARLAINLEEGKPCPVCGAIHHPLLATSTEKIPTDAQINAAESKLKSLLEQKNSAEQNLNSLQTELKLKEKSLTELAETFTAAQAQEEFDKISGDVKALETLQTRRKRGEVKIRDTEEKLSKALDDDKKFSGVVENLRGAVDNMLRELDEKYLSDKELLDAEISSTNKTLDELNAAFNHAQEKFNRLNNRLAAQKSTVDAAEKNKAEIAAQVEGKTPPDMPALKKVLDDTRTAHTSAVETKTKLSERLDRLKSFAKKITALEDDLKAADKNFLMWKTLSDAANGYISKISFQRYYLATMFKEVISEANNRLEKMSSGRYRFRLKEDVSGRERKAGLDLEIFDEYSGTARPVETLSGGESFLASLSLALGLAAVVQNNSGGIRLDTIFIDEGFGSLDIETLDFAMKTLIELQSGGRLVGIISHVEELKNQMPVRLEITKTKTGSTAKFVS